MLILVLLTGVVAAALLLPTVSDLLSLWRVAARRTSRPVPSSSLPRLVFLVPAYNEELLIAHCVRSLLTQDYPAKLFSVVVVADNCTDHTAAVATAAGASCLVRNDPMHPGKPHAVAWALERLSGDADAVVIVDADTVVDQQFATGLAEARPLAEKAVQARNGVSNPGDSPITRMAAVLASVKFEFAFRLKQRAGLNVPLGAGSCIGTAILARYGWHAFSIGEDWEMYTLLTEKGVRIDLAPHARLYAQEARSLNQISTQRRRWTAGRLAVLSRYWRRILASRAIGARQKLDTICELFAPGPVVHLGVVTALTVGFMLFAPGAPRWALALCWISLVRPVVYSTAALLRMPSRMRTVAAFLYLPIYALWRLGIEALALSAIKERAWVRTARHALSKDRSAG
ncbi:MAG: glycosyltransferase family 2 protein [Gemmatimonadetes bacterium]|nr:glycosyltransferase family 2 protein [Gemmatimonadota bacterium]